MPMPMPFVVGGDVSATSRHLCRIRVDSVESTVCGRKHAFLCPRTHLDALGLSVTFVSFSVWCRAFVSFQHNDIIHETLSRVFVCCAASHVCLVLCLREVISSVVARDVSQIVFLVLISRLVSRVSCLAYNVLRTTTLVLKLRQLFSHSGSWLLLVICLAKASKLCSSSGSQDDKRYFSSARCDSCGRGREPGGVFSHIRSDGRLTFSSRQHCHSGNRLRACTTKQSCWLQSSWLPPVPDMQSPKASKRRDSEELP